MKLPVEMVLIQTQSKVKVQNHLYSLTSLKRVKRLVEGTISGDTTLSFIFLTSFSIRTPVNRREARSKRLSHFPIKEVLPLQNSTTR